MRVTVLSALAAALAVACGGEKKAADQTAAQPAAAAPAAATTGTVDTIRLTGNGSTQAAFSPAAITIKAGDVVRFINASGGPHNVAFYADSIPGGAATVLNAAMPNRMDNLSSPFLTTPNQTYDVSFAGAPKGTYKGFCTPHVALGMKMTITVQ
ncbi:MAG TPA: plastocyanin/azurin family copper-binding protein [Gemmatimonadales bacterium]|nr:plastocyanin/azurin family copper-binding protein [Gemmatimonadales bacterium]